MPEDTDRALEGLRVAVQTAQAELEQVLARADVLAEHRRAGRDYAEIVGQEERPLLVERLTSVLDELSVAGAAFRRAEARALHRQGLSQEAIAALFGVTRQRVSVLLQDPPRRR